MKEHSPPATMDAVHIQALMLSTIKRSQRNTNQKAGKPPESMRRGQRSHGRKEKANRRREQMERENDLNLQRVSWDSWESFGKYLKRICRPSWRISDITWGSHEVAETGSMQCSFQRLLSLKNSLTSINGSLWIYILPWNLNFRGDNSFFHESLGH